MGSRGGPGSQLIDSRKGFLWDMAPYNADLLDPFKLERNLNCLQILKVALLSVTLLPIRLILMTLILFPIWIFTIITLWGLPEAQKKGLEPITGWRRSAKNYLWRVVRFAFVVAGWHWIPQKGVRSTRREAPILLLIPHSSFWDSVVISALGCPGVVSINMLRDTPFFGTLAGYMQPLYLDKFDPQSRREAAEKIIHRVTSEKDFEQLIIFPEGGCSNRKSLLNFKQGAFKPRVPVQPVFIRYSNKLDTITWTLDGPKGWKQLWLTLAQFHIFCSIEFLPRYTPDQSERENARLYAENVHFFIARLTDTPGTKFSTEDSLHFETARELNIPLTAGLIKFLRLRNNIERHEMDPEQELQMLNAKESKPVQGDAKAFAAYLNLERPPDALKEFFHLMDQSKSGIIDFRLYNACLCLIRTDLNPEEKIDAAVQIFGTKDTKKIVDDIYLLWRGIPSSLVELHNLSMSDVLTSTIKLNEENPIEF